LVLRRFELRATRTADAADADLHDAGDMRQFARPAHRVGIAMALAVDLATPVDMGVDLHDPDRPV
jgi:hypothetical protein